MLRMKKEYEISPQPTRSMRRCVQSKLSFGKNPMKESVKEREKDIEIGIVKDRVEPLVDEGKELQLNLLDEVTDKCEVIDGEEKKGKTKRICQSKLPWHKPPAEEAEVIVCMEKGQPVESGGKNKRNHQKRTPQKSPLKEHIEERRSSARIKNNKNSQLLANKQNGVDHPETSPGNGDSEIGGSSSKKILKKKRFDAAKDVSSQNVNIPHQITDLRLEARLAAEEYSRLSVGKQTHPFFTTRKAPKRVSEVETHGVKKEGRCWPGLDGDYTVSCPPIHVIDSSEGDIALTDWKNWVFKETPLSNPSSCLTAENTSSVLDGFIKPLMFDNIKGMNVNQAINEVNAHNFFVDSENLKSDNRQLISDSFKNDQEDSLLTERLASYYRRISCWPECSIWANKYQPENALEVCGNSDSVQFLREWLKSWNENSFQSGKMKHDLEPCVIEDSDDSTYETESDMDDELNLKNVLLIKGPVGSGKSAAIYACAKEQGFEVIEVNTSDLRNGTLMKQAFGQAMDSHALNKWSVEAPNVKKGKLFFDLSSSPTVIKEDEDLCNDALSGKQDSSNEEILSWDTQGKCSARCTPNKSLILFEDVDTVFDEDRGFISSIFHLAETAKRPIILTSTCKYPVLPLLLDHMVLDFAFPSKEDLLLHLSMICASEKVDISSDLLEHMIKCCGGDIRKTLMLLQFWCQGKRSQIGKPLKSSYNPLTFDIDAAYLVTQRMISWELPCKLSEKVADEINSTLAKIEEKNIEKMVAMQEQLSAIHIIRNRRISSVKAKKKRKLSKENSFPDSTEILNQFDEFEKLHDLFDSPTSNNAPKSVKRRNAIIMSSQSEDLSDNEHHDVSCVPDSCFMDGFLDISSQNNSIRADPDLNECLEDTCEDKSVMNVELVEENSQKENYVSTCQSQSTDTKLMHCMSDENIKEIDLVQETWNDLRVGRHDLKSYVDANMKDASFVMKHVSGLADLICETDVMFKSCYCLNNDVLESWMVPTFEPDSCSFYEQQVEIGSTYAQHGFCYHTSNIIKAGYNLGHASNTDLAQEMLNSSLNTMALGKLISKGDAYHKPCHEGNLRATIPREKTSELYSVILTTVPPKLSMAIRSSAFHEYVSFYSKISKMECDRISQGNVEKRRRPRVSPHYLSTGSFSMSDEHIQLLAQCNCFN